VLVAMIDDATSRIEAWWFAVSETGGELLRFGGALAEGGTGRPAGVVHGPGQHFFSGRARVKRRAGRDAVWPRRCKKLDGAVDLWRTVRKAKGSGGSDCFGTAQDRWVKGNAFWRGVRDGARKAKPRCCVSGLGATIQSPVSA